MTAPSSHSPDQMRSVGETVTHKGTTLTFSKKLHIFQISVLRRVADIAVRGFSICVEADALVLRIAPNLAVWEWMQEFSVSSAQAVCFWQPKSWPG